jgi:uncharacterized membrane protein YhfC
VLSIKDARSVKVAFFFAILFGAIGSGYLLYARRQYDALFAVFGVALCVFPYFVDSAWATVVVGALLMGAPFVVRRL